MYNYDTYIKTENGMDLLNSNAPNVEIMIGATAEIDGKEGLVPAPVSKNKDKYLKGDGTWSEIKSAKRAEQDENGNKIVDTYANKSLYGDTTVSVGRKPDTVIGEYSFAFGYRNESTGQLSFSMGYMSKTNADHSYTFGMRSIASKSHSHAEGSYCEANGQFSYALGNGAIAHNIYSHAEGYHSEAIGENSHAEGMGIKAYNANSYIFGRYNTSVENYIGKGTTFAIGNGADDSIRSNAFSVTFDGTTKAANTITASTTADYAEFFEWNDGNPNNEDRVGKFVTLDGDKISIAKSNEDYILGIVSGAPFVLGNGDCDVWNGMYMRDDFGRLIYEPAPKEEFDEETGTMKEVFDEDGNLIYEGKRRKLNPDYDPSQKYISRFDRPEWSPIGMLGVLSVIQDGTCAVNGYCCCNNEGIATACDRDTIGSYRVIKKISDQVVRVVFR